MPPFAEIHEEDVEAGSTALGLDFGSHGINLFLKSATVRDDQLKGLSLAALAAGGGETTVDGLRSLRLAYFSRL